MSTKRILSCARSERGLWSALSLIANGALLLAACGGDDMTGPNQPATGLTAGVPATPGVAGTGAAGTATAMAGRGTTTGTSGTGTVGGTAGKPATAGTGSAVPTAGTGTSAAGTGAAAGAGGEPMMATAGAGGTGVMAGAGAAGMADVGGKTPGGIPAESACLDGITNYDTAGPFKFETKTQGAVKMWIPMLPAGCKVPIVHLANGTGATCANYIMDLERFASHGFLTTCYEDANTGAGTQGVMAFDAVMKAYPDMYIKALGSTGHSQGGQAAFTVLELSEEKWLSMGFTMAGLAMEPASGFGTQPSGGSWQSVYAKIKSPMFMFSGTADMLVSQAWVQQGFDALADSIEAYHWSAIGATHIPTPQEPEMNVGVAWWRWKLLGDAKACEWFKKLPDGDKWNSIKEQNAKPCM